MVVRAKSGGIMRKYAWAPGQNWAKLGRNWRGEMELLLPGSRCPGQLPDVWDTGCPGDSGEATHGPLLRQMLSRLPSLAMMSSRWR